MDGSSSGEDSSGSTNDLDLAKHAAAGDVAAREAVSRLAHPLIQQQTNMFCKRFCHENYRHARCTLFPDWGLQSREAPLCDWGNHSYAWMLDDLTRPKRLRTFTGQNGAKLFTYLFAIVNSLPFYERWKDARFGRRIRVPTYIKSISPFAAKVFWGLADGHAIEVIAQEVNIPVDQAQAVADRIVLELTKREKLHLLDFPKTTSLTGRGVGDGEEGDDEDAEQEIADHSWDPGEDEAKRLLAAGLRGLTPVEQYVLKAMVGEGREANEVLAVLVRLGISIKKGVPPEQINRQQLFYFKRVTWAKFAKSFGEKR